MSGKFEITSGKCQGILFPSARGKPVKKRETLYRLLKECKHQSYLSDILGLRVSLIKVCSECSEVFARKHMSRGPKKMFLGFLTRSGTNRPALYSVKKRLEA